MAYQNLKIPRIYVNVLEFRASHGSSYQSTFGNEVYRTLPVGSYDFNQDTAFSVPKRIMRNKSFVAILGHKMGSENPDQKTLSVKGFIPGSGENGWDNPVTLHEIINGYPAFYGGDGFSIWKFNASDYTGFMFSDVVGKIGSFVCGIYFDFPRGPDLNLSLTYEYDGIKKTTNKGGHTFIKNSYTKPTPWGDLGAWELGAGKNHSKSGRRIWDLSYSYLNEDETFPENAAIINTDEAENTYERYENTLMSAGSHERGSLQRVIHLTNGGQLPFIFQTDNTNESLDSPKHDQFAICKFDMNSFKFTERSKGFYNVKLKIREVW